MFSLSAVKSEKLFAKVEPLNAVAVLTIPCFVPFATVNVDAPFLNSFPKNAVVGAFRILNVPVQLFNVGNGVAMFASAIKVTVPQMSIWYTLFWFA